MNLAIKTFFGSFLDTISTNVKVAEEQYGEFKEELENAFYNQNVMKAI